MAVDTQHNVHFMSEKHDWETPQDFFDRLDAEFHFTLDPCCVPATAKCDRYYTPVEDGLTQDWSGETVYMNPPYGREIIKWMKKAYESAVVGGGNSGVSGASTNRHELVAQLRRSRRSTIHTGQTEVWWLQELSPVPVSRSGIQTAGGHDMPITAVGPNGKTVTLEDRERQPCEVYSRIVGYLRPTSEWNAGRKSEWAARKKYIPPIITDDQFTLPL